MKQLRLHIYILLGVFLVTFIIGSFLDLQINESLFTRGEGFSMFMAACGPVVGYGTLAILGGGYLSLAIKKPYKTLIKIVFYGLTVALFAVAVYFAGREFWGENGYNNEKLEWLGYVICVPIMGGLTYLGYWLCAKSKRENLWIILTVLAIACFMALVPGVTILKIIFHRPRFRTIYASGYGIEYHNWWQRCANYKELMGIYHVTKEEFKSFPSGHAGSAALTMLILPFLPLLDEKYQKLQIPLVYASLAWTMLMSFSRMVVGAHFLSDVSMGSLLTLVFLLLSNEFIIHCKKLNPEETPVQE